MVQLSNQLRPGNFRVGKVGRAYQDHQEIKVDNINEEGLHGSINVSEKDIDPSLRFNCRYRGAMQSR